MWLLLATNSDGSKNVLLAYNNVRVTVNVRSTVRFERRPGGRCERILQVYSSKRPRTTSLHEKMIAVGDVNVQVDFFELLRIQCGSTYCSDARVRANILKGSHGFSKCQHRKKEIINHSCSFIFYFFDKLQY